jgi:hypothetical protein
MNEKDCFDDFIVGFGFRGWQGAPGGTTTTIVTTVSTTAQDERAIKFSTIFLQLL